VLQEIKNDRTLQTIPVVVLTTSRDEQDVNWCYRAGANSYVQKPVRLDEMDQAIRAVMQYWFNTVLLPGNE
jgi:DNA-binding NarL/FixJ family response regulator